MSTLKGGTFLLREHLLLLACTIFQKGGKISLIELPPNNKRHFRSFLFAFLLIKILLKKKVDSERRVLRCLFALVFFLFFQKGGNINLIKLPRNNKKNYFRSFLFAFLLIKILLKKVLF